MKPNNSTINNNPSTTNANFQQPTNPMSGTTQGGPVIPMNEMPQQSPVVSQPYTMNGSIAQSIPQTPHHITVMTRVCLVLGIITLIGTVLGLGLFLFGQEKTTGLMMIYAMRYSFIFPIGTLVCIATIIAIITAKDQYHTSIKKPILTVVYSALMIYAPMIIVGLFAAFF